MAHCWVTFILLSLLFSGCTATIQQPALHLSPTALQTATPFLETSTPTLPPTHTPSPSPVPTQTLPPPTATSTPEPLALFQTRELRTGVQPASYITNTCEYLNQRWDPKNSAPGTIIVPVMFHSIAKPGRTITDNTTISEEYFVSLMEHAHSLGFETITTQQLIDFVTHNAPIPPRSMILILDDRRPGVTELFLPYLEKFDWTLTLAWISAGNSDSEWERMEGLAASGHLDVQVHGYHHVYIQPETDIATIRDEMFSPIPLIENHFGNTPLAYIWPGGNFTETAVSIAHQAGYQVGFTAFSRGPIMYNWVPLGAPEQAIHDPLMVLPRFWSTAAYVNLDQAVKIAEQAQADAKQNKEREIQYLETYCQP